MMLHSTSLVAHSGTFSCKKALVDLANKKAIYIFVQSNDHNTMQWRIQDFIKEGAELSARETRAKIFTATPTLLTTPGNFNAATPISWCAILRIVLSLH